MNAFVDYTFYTGTYLGSVIPTADFNHLALEASHFINAVTFGRAETVITDNSDADLVTKVKMATCAAAEGYYINLDTNAQGGTGVIQSEKIGNYSVTYALAGDIAQSLGMAILRKASPYLADTDLLYRGV